MIDLGLLRDDLERITVSEKKRARSTEQLQILLKLDARWRDENKKLELIREKINTLGRDEDSAKKHRDDLKRLKREAQALEGSVDRISQERKNIAGFLGNIVSDDVPEGKNELDSVVIKKYQGHQSEGSLSHEELMEKKSGLDLVTASIFSGSRFRYLIGEIAEKNRCLQQLAIEFAREKGFSLVIPPVIAQAHTLEATGFFPKGKEDMYELDSGQFLVGTSEPMLLVLGANTKFSESSFPVRYVGVSTCFRKEAGSYGKDVKGMFRVHQFDKVELVSFVVPENSASELDYLVSIQEEFISKFNLSYQQVLLCAADQSQAASKQIDHEIWFPSQGRYRETHSASNCTDYQSRDLKIKVERKGGAQLAHTLNGTLATERLLLAIIENYQKLDGTIAWPEILR